MPNQEQVDVRPAALYAPEMPTAEQFAALEAQNVLSGLIQTYTAERVHRWLHSLAIIHGQEIK